MPLRLLWAAGERLQLWKEGGDDAEVHRQRKTDGRPRREQELFDFAPDPLGRQIVERNGPAQRTRLGVELEIETSDELDCAQHPETVVGECAGVDHPQVAPLEVVAAVERIEVLVG